MFAQTGWAIPISRITSFDKYVTKMKMSEHLWTETNNYFSAGTAISANAPTGARDDVPQPGQYRPYVATMMRFGVEGIHYKRDAEAR